MGRDAHPAAPQEPALMALRWSTSAHRDLIRLHDYLAPVDPRAASRAVQRLLRGARQLARHPRLGVRLAEFDPREVRRLLVDDYELRYEVRDTELIIVRIFHAHEDR